MERPLRKLTLDDVRTTTHFHRTHLKEWIANATAAGEDAQRKERRKRQECPWCFYARSTRIAGQAFTSEPCGICTTMQTYPTTSTNRVCEPCGRRHRLCVHCGSDIDLKDRRNLERKR